MTVGVKVRVAVREGVIVGVWLGVGVGVSVITGRMSTELSRSSKSRRIHPPSYGRIDSFCPGATKSQKYPSFSKRAENQGHMISPDSSRTSMIAAGYV